MKTGRKPISQDKIKLINELAKKGMSSSKIASRLDISKRAVLNYKKDKKQLKILNDDIKNKIRELRKEYSILKVSKMLNISRQSVRKYENYQG